MTMKKKADNEGRLYWHIHHSVLVEWSDNIQERVDYIKEHKPKEEIPTRLRLLRPVKGKLPLEFVKVWKACCKAWKACCKAEEAYHKAREAYHKAEEAYHKAEESYYKAREAYCKAKESYGKALEKHKKEILALHKKECGCNWTEEKGIDFKKKELKG